MLNYGGDRLSLLVIAHRFKFTKDINDYNLLESRLNDIIIKYAFDELNISQKEVISNEAKTIFGYMLGEIYDINKNNLILKGHIFTTDTDIEYIIHLYEEYGEKALIDLNGKFIICIIDKEKDKVVILNDRYGFYTFYYYQQDDFYCFCNVPKIIVDSINNKKIDLKSFQEFFNYGYLLGNRTLIQGINKIPPASIIEIKNNRIDFKSYWNWNYIKKARSVCFEEAVEKLGLLWIEAIDKILKKHEKVYLTLSGGLDSRAILAAIDYLGMNHKVDSILTFGQKDSLDYVIASSAARLTKIQHIFIELNSNTWWENIDFAIENGLGEINIIHTHGSCLNKIKPKYVILDGFAGDLIMGGSYLQPEFINAKKEYTLRLIDEKMKSEGLKNSLLIKGLRERDLKREYLAWESTDYFFINNRVKNFTNNNMLGDKYYRVYPFFDNTLIDYVYSLPSEWRLDSKIYKVMLLRYFPKFFSDISWQKTGLPLCISAEDLDNYKINLQYDKQKPDVILFGASTLGKKILFNYKDHWNIRYFTDNDPNKWGKTVMGVKILPPREIKKLGYQVIITSMYENEIEKQLEEMNIKNYQKSSEHKGFQRYKDWIMEPNIMRTIEEELTKSDFVNDRFYNMDEVKRIISSFAFDNQQHEKKDICLLYTFKKFYERFINVHPEQE